MVTVRADDVEHLFEVIRGEHGLELMRYGRLRAALAAPTFGDHVQDGGEWGTIVRCGECGGSGQLHRLDKVPDPTAPVVSEPAQDEAQEIAAWALDGHEPVWACLACGETMRQHPAPPVVSLSRDEQGLGAVEALARHLWEAQAAEYPRGPTGGGPPKWEHAGADHQRRCRRDASLALTWMEANRG